VFIADGCRLAAEYDVASVCVRPTDVHRAAEVLAGTDVAVGTVIGFPHGSSTTATKVFEAREALANSARELDMVIGALKSGRDERVGGRGGRSERVLIADRCDRQRGGGEHAD